MDHSYWRILLVEDSEDDYILTRAWLNDVMPGQFRLTWERDVQPALAVLSSFKPDVLLVDYDLAEQTGLDFLREARAQGCRAPAILLTGHPSYDLDLEAMKAGVAEYVEKSHASGPLLERVIRYAIERQQTQQRLEQMNEELEVRVHQRTRQVEQANRLLEQIFTSIRVMIAYLDRDFNFLRVNRLYAEADGKSESFFPGKNHFELYPNPDNEAIFRRVVESGEPYSALNRPFQFPAHPERGITYWDWSLQPVKDQNGLVTSLILSMVDVTEQAHARQALSYQAFLLENVNDAIVAADPDFCYTSWNQTAEKMYGWKRSEVIGRHTLEILKTQYQGTDYDGVVQRLRETGQFASEAINTRRDGSQVPVEVKITALKDSAGKITGFVSIHRDITERRRAEAKVRGLLARLESLAEFTHLLGEASLDHHKILQLLARRTAEIIGDACVVTQLSDDGQVLVPVAFYHPQPEARELMRELLAHEPSRVGEGLAGITAQTGKSLLIPEVSPQQLRPRVSPHLRPYLERYAICSVLIVPLKFHDRLIGTLGVTRDQPGSPYTPEDQTFLEALAGRATLWIVNAGLFQQAQVELNERRRVEGELNEIQRQLMDGAEAERLNLARELHDGPIQEMYALSMQLESLSEDLPQGENNESLAGLLATTQRVIDSLRATTMELRPPVLSRFGLTPAIRSHCAQVSKSQPELRIQLELAIQHEPAGSERCRLALYRIFQVALTNIIRHAHAHQATIRLRETAEHLILEVQDNGVGFHVPPRWVEMARQGHLGLVGAIERVEAMGGRMQVISNPGAGTTIHVEMPKEA